MATTWTATDPRWQALSPYQKAAAMALMEADGADPDQARNALGAMINRAGKGGEDLGQHVSGRIYQPSIEPTQQARLDRILRMPAFGELSQWAERRSQGYEPDPVNGATHFLAHEPVMERLRAQNPNKYRSWVNWTGYDANGGQYANVTTRDRSHAFLAPDGRYSVPVANVEPVELYNAPPSTTPAPVNVEPEYFPPGGSLERPQPIPPPATTAVAGVAKPEPTWQDKLGGYGQAALKIAKAATDRPQMPAMRPMQLVHADPIRPNPRGLAMAAASIPYGPKGDAADQALRLARGGAVDPSEPVGGAGRFAEPRIAPEPERRDPVRGWLDRLTGIGRLPYADGGSVDNTGANIPETPDSLKAQQHEVLVGRRPAMMFPRGTEELPLPQGLRRVETPRGVFHFDPLQITAQDIAEASATGRENEILGLGPLSKDDVLQESMRTGEKPVAITQRDKMGNEIRSSVATPSSIPDQSDEMLRSAPDDHSVDVEPIGDVLRGRMGDGSPSIERAMGGAVGGGLIEGALHGATGGRADQIPGAVRSGSHVIPAYAVSHLGGGNTLAGVELIKKLFSTGPYGVALPKARRSRGLAIGGEPAAEGEAIPVRLSDGEVVLTPEQVAAAGGGDIDHGHDVLDSWIKSIREDLKRTMEVQPDPATD